MSILRFRVVSLIALLCSLLAAPVARAVVDGVPVPTNDRRFDGVGIFLRVAPGNCGGWVSGTCTLVAPNVVLIARHCLDITTADPLPLPSVRQYRARFRRAPNGFAENNLSVNWNQCHGVYQEFDVVQLIDAQNVGCDQVLAVLSAAPVGIVPISVSIDSNPIPATNIILAGWGYRGECFGSGDHWGLSAARGRLPDNWSSNDYLAFSWCAVGTVAPCLSCPTIGGPFVTANLHDSGAPILIEVPSTDPLDPTPELRVIGTVSSANSGRRPIAWNNAGGQPTLVARAPVRHIYPGDFNGDGIRQITDLLSFFDAFFAGRPEADADGNGILESADILYFVGLWFH